jgi:hypothetical protein
VRFRDRRRRQPSAVVPRALFRENSTSGKRDSSRVLVAWKADDVVVTRTGWVMTDATEVGNVGFLGPQRAKL